MSFNAIKDPLHAGDDDDDVERLMAIVAEARRSLEATGVAVFHDFVAGETLESMREEARHKADRAYVSRKYHNAYLQPDDDPSFPSDHVRNRKLFTTVGSIAYDELDDNGALRRLYEDPLVIGFIQRVLGEDRLYRLDDKLGACSINVFKSGWSHSWHFDESEYTTTLCLQNASSGGDFKYSARLRSSDQELAWEKVQAIVDEKEEVSTLEFRPGTLALFAGRYSLHCVEPVHGDQDRLVAVLCYATQPGVRNSPNVQEQFWGRVKL